MQRDISIDMLRGLMLVVMAVDHFSGNLAVEGLLTEITWETFGFVSAGEGFVFLSGLVAGLVYGKYALRGMPVLTQKILQRVWLIYRFHLGLVAMVWAGAWLIPSYNPLWQDWAPLYAQAPLGSLLASAPLIYQPEFMDILPLYTVLLLLLPLLLQAYLRHHAHWVLLISLAVWGMAQLGLRDEITTWLPAQWPVSLGYFDIFAWQILFVGGSWIGFRRAAGLPGVTHHRLLLPFALMVAVLCIAMRRDWYIPVIDVHLAAERSELAWFRLLNFVLVAYVFAWITQRDWRWLSPCPRLTLAVTALLEWLAFLGRHSLQVFAFHVAVVYFAIAPALHYLNAYPVGLAKVSWELAITAVFIASLSLPAWAHQKMQHQP